MPAVELVGDEPPRLHSEFIDHVGAYSGATAILCPAHLHVGLFAFASSTVLATFDHNGVALAAAAVAALPPDEEAPVVTCDAPGSITQSLAAGLAAAGHTVTVLRFAFSGLPGPRRLESLAAPVAAVRAWGRGRPRRLSSTGCLSAWFLGAGSGTLLKGV